MSLVLKPLALKPFEALDQTGRLPPLEGSGDKYLCLPTFCRSSIQYANRTIPRYSCIYLPAAVSADNIQQSFTRFTRFISAAG